METCLGKFIVLSNNLKGLLRGLFMLYNNAKQDTFLDTQKVLARATSVNELSSRLPGRVWCMAQNGGTSR